MSAGSGDDGQRAQTTEELRADIARRRSELGDTVAALAAKTDIKALVRERAGRLRGNLAGQARGGVRAARERTGRLTVSRRTTARREVPPNTRAAVAAAVIAVAVAAVWLRRRARRTGAAPEARHRSAAAGPAGPSTAASVPPRLPRPRSVAPPRARSVRPRGRRTHPLPPYP